MVGAKSERELGVVLGGGQEKEHLSATAVHCVRAVDADGTQSAGSREQGGVRHMEGRARVRSKSIERVWVAGRTDSGDSSSSLSTYQSISTHTHTRLRGVEVSPLA